MIDGWRNQFYVANEGRTLGALRTKFLDHHQAQMESQGFCWADEVERMLRQPGPQLNVPDEHGITPLMVAVYHALLHHEDHEGPLYMNTVKKLLEYPGIDMNRRAHDGMTVFDLINSDPNEFNDFKRFYYDDQDLGICPEMQRRLRLIFQQFRFQQNQQLWQRRDGRLCRM